MILLRISISSCMHNQLQFEYYETKIKVMQTDSASAVLYLF